MLQGFGKKHTYKVLEKMTCTSNFIVRKLFALFHKSSAWPSLSVSLTGSTDSYFMPPFFFAYSGVERPEICQQFSECVTVILSCFCSNKITKMKDIYRNNLSSSWKYCSNNSLTILALHSSCKAIFFSLLQSLQYRNRLSIYASNGFQGDLTCHSYS